MAMLNSFAFIVTLLLLELASNVKGLTPTLEASAPLSAEFFTNCEGKLSEKCAENVFNYIFHNGTEFVAKDCCEALVLMGRTCHEQWFTFITSKPKYALEVSKKRHRSDKIWNNCFEIAGPVLQDHCGGGGKRL